MSMSRDSVTTACGMAAVVFACAVPFLGSLGQPGYSHVTQYISELGATGARNSRLVGLLGFAPTGLFVLLFLAAAPFPKSRSSRMGALALSAVGVAYVVSAFAPCDPGCPAAGSWSQSVHNFFGAGEYVGASTGLMLMAAAFRDDARWQSRRRLSLVCAGLVLVGFAAMLVPWLASYRGAAQRLADAAIFLWIGVSALHVARVDSHGAA